MFHKVRSVQPLPDYLLLVRFQDSTQKRYDVKPLFTKWPVFQSLQKVPGLYQQVRVEPGGYAVAWNDDIDLSCDELWENGNTVEGDVA